jgi:hypothetical protein
MSFRSLFTLSLLLTLTSCAQFYAGRAYLAEMDGDELPFFNFNPEEDFPVVAGDMGHDWPSASQSRKRTPASVETDPASEALASELKRLEKMETSEDLELYYAYKNSFSSISQQIYFLKLPPYERRDYLLTSGLLKEARATRPLPFDPEETQRKNDVLIGMTKNEVLESMGRPIRVEIAGNPRNQNERWLYNYNNASKYIYFESGEVQGWE